MKCKCSSLTEVFYLNDAPKGFKDYLKEIDTDTKNWMVLFECTSCGALWVIDEWDKYTWQVASRIENMNCWPTSIPIEKRKALLLKSRGGNTDEKCIWANCEQRRVKDVVYCIDHLYNTGARK